MSRYLDVERPSRESFAFGRFVLVPRPRDSRCACVDAVPIDRQIWRARSFAMKSISRSLASASFLQRGIPQCCASLRGNLRSIVTHLSASFVAFRTKWKRQTIVGFEIMAENNFAVAAFQQLYGSGAATIPAPAAGRYWQYPSAHTLPANGFFYQQASAAATLQKPLPYRLYPPTMILAGPSNPLGSLTASSSLSSLSNYYRDNPEMADGRESSRKRDRSKSPEGMRDRSPTERKSTRLYSLPMMQAGPSNPLGSLTAASNLPNVNNYYRDSPELVEGRENVDRSRKQDRGKSPDSRDRSPLRKDARAYAPMIQAGPSNHLAGLGAGSSLPGLNNYYRDSPEMVDGREANRMRQRDRSESQDRSPMKREDSPRSIRCADSDEESIHDI